MPRIYHDLTSHPVAWHSGQGGRHRRRLTSAFGPMKAILLATIAAITVQPVVFFFLILSPVLFAGGHMSPQDLFGLPLFAALFAAPFVVVLGIPAHLTLRHFNRLSWWSLGAFGFLVAALPVAIYGYSDYSGYSSGGNWYGTSVDFVINGQKTFYGWLSYVQDVVFLGLHGFAGALAFFFVCRRSSIPNSSFKTDASGTA